MSITITCVDTGPEITIQDMGDEQYQVIIHDVTPITQIEVSEADAAFATIAGIAASAEQASVTAVQAITQVEASRAVVIAAEINVQNLRNETQAFRDQAHTIVTDTTVIVNAIVADLEVHTDQQIAEITAHASTQITALNNHRINVVEPAINTHRTAVVQPAIDTYRTGTVQPAIDNYRITVVQPAIDSHANAQVAAQVTAQVTPQVTLAQRWANEAEDVVVQGGLFSARHYMEKSMDYAASMAAQMIFGCYNVNEINNLINVEGYIPIATPEDFNAIRTAQTRVFGTGSLWQRSYTSTGLTGRYIQVNDIDMFASTQTPTGAYWRGGLGFQIILGFFRGIYDGGGRVLRNIRIEHAIFERFSDNINAPSTIRNWGIEDLITGENTIWGLLGARNTSFYNVNQFWITGIDHNATGVWTDNGVFSRIDGGVIQNTVIATQTSANTGGYATVFVQGAGRFERSLFLGTISTGNLGAGNSATNTVFFNSDILESGVAAGANFVGQTTAQLQALTEAALDGTVWEFRPNRYPILRAFGERTWNRIQPLRLRVHRLGTNARISFVTVFTRPTVFNLYSAVWNTGTSRWGVWTKIAESANHWVDVPMSSLPANLAHVKFFVKGEYR